MSSSAWVPPWAKHGGSPTMSEEEGEEDAGLLMESRSEWGEPLRSKGGGGGAAATERPKRQRRQRRSRTALTWLLASLAFLTVVGLLSAWFTGTTPGSFGRNRKVAGPLRQQAYQRRLAQLAKQVDLKAAQEDYNLKGDLLDYDAYRERLRKTWDDYFTPATPGQRRQGGGETGSNEGVDVDVWANVEAHLDPLRTSPGEIPRIVSSSAKNKSAVMPAFNSWREKNAGWQVQVFDDDEAATFIASTLHGLGAPGAASGDGTSFPDLMAKMPSNILRVDTFRYFRVFFAGGLYVDSDTSCRNAISEWPGLHGPDPIKVSQGGDEVLRFLSTVAREDLTIAEDGPLPRWAPPSLVMALEEDSFMAREDWRAMTFAKPLQVTQWAFMAESYHPVFLDALGTIMERTRNELKHGTQGDYINQILEWTGPGMLTDAFWRYMFAMYGVQPRDFTYHQRAFRVGDLLMYPHMAFRAPEEPQDDLHMIVHHHKHEWWRRR